MKHTLLPMPLTVFWSAEFQLVVRLVRQADGFLAEDIAYSLPLTD